MPEQPAPPQPVDRDDAAPRRRVSLCLSGGGYRAALFHLGALRRLDELGVLGAVETVSSVSGGSIVAALLAERLRPWPVRGERVDDFDARVAEPLRRFCRRNIRTGPFLRRALPWNWVGTGSAVDSLAAAYERHLTSLRIADLPERPEFVLCSTDMSYGVNWVFSRRRTGDYMAGYLDSAGSWPLARAVAASSCFPPVFNPMRLGLRPEDLRDGKDTRPERAEAVAHIGLTDGGVYDNLGLEPVWRRGGTVLVSDGGAPFDYEPDQGLIWRLQRYTGIVGRQASGLRKRWLVQKYESGELGGCYWGIGNSTADYGGGPGYDAALVDATVARVRTDLDAFSAAEQAVLENHGYTLADRAIARYAPEVVEVPAPAVVPHPEWLDPESVRAALARSHRLTLPFGRR